MEAFKQSMLGLSDEVKKKIFEDLSDLLKSKGQPAVYTKLAFLSGLNIVWDLPREDKDNAMLIIQSCMTPATSESVERRPVKRVLFPISF